MTMEMDGSAHLTTFTWLSMWLSLFITLAWLHFKSRSSPSLPGPWGLPIIGHLHLLHGLVHRSLHKLSTMYGPIIHVRLGLVPAIVISSPEAAELFLRTHDASISSKPYGQVSKHMSYGGKGIISAEYGQYWRDIRKLATMHLFSAAKTDSFRSTRENEISRLIKLLKGAAERHEVVDLCSNVELVVEEIASRMVLGLRKINERLKPAIEEVMRMGAAPDLSNFIPFIGAFDLQGYTRRWKELSKNMDEFLENIINKHEHESIEKQEHLGGFINVLMASLKSNNPEEKLDRTEIKANTWELLAAAMCGAASTTGWAVSELLRHPQVMKRLQDELEHVVGLDRLVEESHLPNLEYLDMVVKETMRLHPVVAIMLRESVDDFVVNGMKIPSNTMILVNNWAIGRDPVAWPERAEEFYPERFVNSQVDIRGHDMQLLPFGSGRRQCPGMEMGIRTIKLVLAQLIHCFNWELPNGMSPEDLDMEEDFGLNVPRANHLRLMATYRLHKDDI